MRKLRMTLYFNKLTHRLNIDEINDTTTEEDEGPNNGNKNRKKKKRQMKPDPIASNWTDPI